MARAFSLPGKGHDAGGGLAFASGDKPVTASFPPLHIPPSALLPLLYPASGWSTITLLVNVRPVRIHQPKLGEPFKVNHAIAPRGLVRLRSGHVDARNVGARLNVSHRQPKISCSLSDVEQRSDATWESHELLSAGIEIATKQRDEATSARDELAIARLDYWLARMSIAIATLAGELAYRAERDVALATLRGADHGAVELVLVRERLLTDVS